MTKMLKTSIGVGALLFAALIAPAQASWCGNGGCDLNGCDTGCGKAMSLWYYNGHAEFGLYGNSHGQRNVYNANGWIPTSGNTIALGPARHADLQMNQLYGLIGKKLNKRGWDVGGRLDFMYGTDALFTQSNGFEYYKSIDPANDRDRWGKGDYLASFPQAYGEVGYQNLSVKLGKFYTPLAGDAIMSPNRFFYSTSYAFGHLPMTQTGAVATWDINPCLSTYGGWTNGEDFGENRDGFGDSTFAKANNNAALFGFNYQANRKFSLGYGILMGKNNKWYEYDDFIPPLDDDYYERFDTSDQYFVHVFSVNYKPNRCWDYTFQWVLRNNNYNQRGYWEEYDNAPSLVGSGTWKGSWSNVAYGINQELIYKLNRCWAFGGRGEWMYGNYGVDANFYQFTLGTNYTPNNWLVVRPEIRYDYCDEDFFKMGQKKDQFGVGVSTIVKF